MGLGVFFLNGNPWNSVRIGAVHFSYVFYSYTMIAFGAYGLFMVWKHGYRGLFLAIIIGLTCDIAQSFLGGSVTSEMYYILENNYAIEPVFWFVAIWACWAYCRPLKLNLVSSWSIGMLVAWLAALHFYYYFGEGANHFIQPVTMASWMIAAYKVVKPTEEEH